MSIEKKKDRRLREGPDLRPLGFSTAMNAAPPQCFVLFPGQMKTWD
jgi:hypothetical protein